MHPDTTHSAMSTVTFLLLLSLIAVTRAFPRIPLTIPGVCVTGLPPVVTNRTSGCGVPSYVDQAIFGDNLRTTGTLRIFPRHKGLHLTLVLNNLPRPNLVLTAWFIWKFPQDPGPSIFDTVADIASPVATSTAAFSSGLSTEPNEIRYINSRTAILRTALNFNPTYPDEGPLKFGSSCFQKDIPGIGDTPYRQFPVPRTGTFTPASSNFLRQYDVATGFEKLGKDGRPLLVRSPIKAEGIVVASHIDHTTHGVSQGNFPVDHYGVIFFPFADPVGSRIVS